MAVIIQEVVGNRVGSEYCYPCLAGVANSVDFYPTKGSSEEDGCLTISAGLGVNVVDGGETTRISLGQPHKPVLRLTHSTPEYPGYPDRSGRTRW